MCAPTVMLHVLIVSPHHCFSVSEADCTVISAPITNSAIYACLANSKICFRVMLVNRNDGSLLTPQFRALINTNHLRRLYSPVFAFSTFIMALPSPTYLGISTEMDASLELPAYSLKAASETEPSNLASNSDAISTSPVNASDERRPLAEHKFVLADKN
jgi:hypothetical protein